MKTTKEFFESPANRVTLVALAAAGAFLGVVAVPSDNTHTFDKNQPARITKLLETTRNSGSIIGITPMDDRTLPYVELKQCETQKLTDCATITVNLPENYIPGTFVLGQLLVVSTDI